MNASAECAAPNAESYPIRSRPIGASAWLLFSQARCSRPSMCMLICMQSTSVRIDVSTHEELKRLATELNTTVGSTVSLAVRALRQCRIGDELNATLRKDETAWLDADLG